MRTHSTLTLARTNIANCLRRAPETVSRVLKRLQENPHPDGRAT